MMKKTLPKQIRRSSGAGKIPKEGKLSANGSDNLYRQLFVYNNDAIFIADAKTRMIVDCNKEAEKLMGYSRNKILAMRGDQLHPAELSKNTIAEFKLLVSGKRIFIESDILARGNVRVPVEISGTRIEFEGKHYLAGAFRNIEKRRKVEEKLLRIMTAVEATSEAVGISDATGRHIYQNKALSKLFEFSSAEELQAAGGGRARVKDPAVAKDIYENIMNGRSWAGELEMVTKSGRVFPAYERADSIKNDKGEVVGLIGVISDISQRVAAEENLRLSEEKYRTLAEIAEDPIYVINRHGRIEYANSFAASYFNKKPEEMIGASLSEFFKSKRAIRMMASITKVFKTKKPISVLGEFKFHDSNVWLDTRISPIMNDTGDVIKVMGVSRDVTTHRIVEKILERDNIELDKLVKASSQKLLAAQKKMGRVERLAEIGTLSAKVAHELRSPLAAIALAAYNIRSKSRDERLRINIHNIEKKVIESDQIINNLLLYSGVKSPIREHIKVRDILDECIELAHSRYPGHKVRFKKSFKCSREVTLKADRVQLHEIFTNIINNSFESFVGKIGRINIVISVIARDMLKIAITDNGPGIAPEALKHIFEPFHSTKNRGTGLGLPVCKQLIELHDGSIEVRSSRSDGTTVTVYFPLTHKENV